MRRDPRRWRPAGTCSTCDDIDRAGRAGRPADGRQRLRAPSARTPTRRRSTGCAASRRWSRCKRRVADVIDVADRRALRLADHRRRRRRRSGRCCARRSTAGRRPRRRLPAPRDRRRRRRAATDVFLELAAESRRAGRPAHRRDARPDGVTACRSSPRACSAGFAARRHGQPLRQPRPAARSTSSGRSPSSSPRPASAWSRSPTPTCSSRAAAPAPMPRGLTGVPALRAAGVNVAAGADNLQDPFNPVGRACPFETAGADDHGGPRPPGPRPGSRSAPMPPRVIGPVAAAIAPGAPADLIAVRADTLREAIAFGPADRIVWRHGQRRASAPTT